MTMSLLLLRILLAFSLLLISVDSEHYYDGSGNEQDAGGGEFFPEESQYRYASFFELILNICLSKMIVRIVT